MIRTSLGLFLALVEFEGQLFSYLENLTRLNCIREGMRKGKKDGGDQCHFQSSFCLVKVFHPQLPLSHLPSDQSRHNHICSLWDLMGAKQDALPGVLHETIEEDKGKELAFGGFRSPPLVDAEDVEVRPLHTIFDLKGSLLGRSILELITSCLFHLIWPEVLPYQARALYPHQL